MATLLYNLLCSGVFAIKVMDDQQSVLSVYEKVQGNTHAHSRGSRKLWRKLIGDNTVLPSSLKSTKSSALISAFIYLFGGISIVIQVSFNNLEL